MKYIMPLFLIILLYSCGTSQKPVTETRVDTTEDVSKTVAIGTKVETTKPVRDLETTTAISTTDSIVEINPQQVVIIPDTDPKVVSAVQKMDHSVWNKLLQQFVSKDGVVDYKGFQNNRTQLTGYINLLGEHKPDETWSNEEIVSYWMNAYNAMTVDLILRHLPLKSIKDIQDPWKQRYWKIGAKYYNLDEIEHQILRKMNEPRIHFGINCASFSCPPLLNEAFTAETVNDQLDTLATQFINDPQRNTITKDRVEISKLFSWFSKDFKQNGSLIDYLNQYATPKISAGAQVRYKDYNWALNN